jgi:hypothetical protein
MSSLNGVVEQLKKERHRAAQEVSQLDAAIRALTGAVPLGIHAVTADSTEQQPKRIVSATARRKMRIAQQARWAKVRAKSNVGGRNTSTNLAGKRSVSAASRRKMAAAQKARWAKVKAGKKAA